MPSYPVLLDGSHQDVRACTYLSLGLFICVGGVSKLAGVAQLEQLSAFLLFSDYDV
jgi:hypothetical protein